MDNEAMELIEMLYTMVSEAWGVPLGNDKCIVERDKVLGILEEIKARLPGKAPGIRPRRIYQQRQA